MRSALSAGIRSSLRAFSVQNDALSFDAELTINLNVMSGVGPASFTRNASATVFDHNGVLRTALSNEARFSGARRVQNLLKYSQDFSNAVWAVYSTAAKVGLAAGVGPSGESCMELSFGTNTFSTPCYQTVSIVSGRTYVQSYMVRAKSADTTVRMDLPYSGADHFSADIAVSATQWRIISFTHTPSASTTSSNASLRNNSAGNAGNIYVLWGQCEDVTGQINQSVGEYVSTNVLSFPYHGAGVDGVKYFDTTNGNTVSNSIVTPGTGLPLAPSIYGRFGKQYLVYGAWAASTTYAASSRVIPIVDNGYYYQYSGGTTGATEPVWPTTIGNTVADGTGTWTCQGHYKLHGYLSEGQRTNNLLQCRNFADAAWTNSATALTATQNAVGIDGAANTAWTLSATDGMNQYKTQAVTVANDSTTHAASWFVQKTTTASYVGVGFTLTGGTTTLQAQFTFNTSTGLATARTGNAAGATARADLHGGCWWVQVVCANNTTGNVTMTYGIYPCVATSDTGTWAAALTGSAVFDWAQVEVGAAFASTPILTTTGTVTRPPDNLSYPLAGNVSIPIQTISYQVRHGFTGLGVGLTLSMHLSAATARYIGVEYAGQIYAIGATAGKYTTVTPQKGRAYKTVFRNGDLFIDGGLQVSGLGALAVAGDTTLYIGSKGGGVTHYGTLRGVKIFNRALSDAEVVAL